MFSLIKKVFSTESVRKKINTTLILLLICRIGTYIPVPGINGTRVIEVFKSLTGTSHSLFQLIDVFSGGAFAQMTVFALGVMPYISASIIMQILVAVFPGLQREMKEGGEMGKKKLGKWTRLFTIFLALFQSALLARYALNLNLVHAGMIVEPILQPLLFNIPYLFYLIVMVAMGSGTLLLMWIGEQITEYGIGNGMSLIISLGILSSIPKMIKSIVERFTWTSPGFTTSAITPFSLVIMMIFFFLIIVGTILVIQGTRKIPLQYARRIVGRRESQGGRSHIPLKVNYAGVIPVIFASSLLMFPATIAQFLSKGHFLSVLANMLSPGSLVHTILFVLLILFFTYFWTATQFNPRQIASDMKRNGAFIPGIRQGNPTQKFLESTMNRVTCIGGVFLAMIAVIPTIIGKLLHLDQSITQFFGGTSILILVGVILDTAKQIDSHFIMKRYDGFMTLKKGAGSV